VTKPSVSPPGILMFWTVSWCHYITHAKVCLLSVIWPLCGKAGSVSQCENFKGWAKTRQPFSAVSWPKFAKFGVHVGSLCKFTSSVWLLMISCSVAEMSSVKVQSRSQESGFLPPSPWGRQMPEGIQTNFLQIAVISEYASQSLVEIRSVTSEIRRQIKRKKPQG